MGEKIPEEIIRYILQFNINKVIYNLFTKKPNNIFFNYYFSNYHKKLFNCHKEIMNSRPCYYKISVGGFTPGISDSPTWHNFKRNSTIKEWYYIDGVQNYIELELSAIEITPERPPNNVYWHSRDIRLYYGWKRCNDPQFWNQIARINSLQRETFSPGFY